MSINRHTPEDDANSRPQRETTSDSPNKPTGETASPENAPKNVPSTKVAENTGVERSRANAEIKRPEMPVRRVSSHGLSDNKIPDRREDVKTTKRTESPVETEAARKPVPSGRTSTDVNKHKPEQVVNGVQQASDTQRKSLASTDGGVNAQGEGVEEGKAEGKNTSTQKMAAVKPKKQEPKDISKSVNQASVRPPANAVEAKSTQAVEAKPTQAQPTRMGAELAKPVEAKPKSSVEAKPAKAADAESAKPTNSVEAKPAGREPTNSVEVKSAKPTERKSVPAAPITPVPRPRFDHVVTPQQEEAIDRLERKRRRMRRGTDITPVVKGGAGQEPAPTQSEEQSSQPSLSEATVSDKPTEALAMKSPESTREKPKEVRQEKRSEADLAEVPTVAFAMKSPESTREKPKEVRQEKRSEADLAEVPTVAFAMKSSAGALTKRSEADLAEVPTAAFAMKPAAVQEKPAVEVDRSRDLDLWRAQRQRKWMLRHISRKRMRESRATKQRVTNRVWLTVFSIFLTLMVVFLTLTGASSFAVYQLYNSTATEFGSQIVNLRDLMPKDNLKIYDSKGVMLGQLTDNGVHTTVPLSQISKQIINAEVSTEDKNFWTNPGIDVARIFQSAIDDLRTGHVVAGGSTITQQLIKNLVVGDQTSLQRKMQEIMLTPIINDRYSKTDIMEMYLNTVYYGEQAYGVDAAANIYYGMADQSGQPAAEKLDLAQSAMLAGIVSSPSAYDPLLHQQLAFERFDIVLNGMVTNGYATRAQADAAAKEAHSPHFFKSAVNMTDLAPHFDQFVEQQLEQSFHLTRAQLSRSDMKVYTTLDIGLQNKIQKIAQEHIAELQYNNVSNAAEVLIDFHTGAIISMLGSIDYNDKAIDGQFNVATAYRQPGSSFKPYVYVTAFSQGISPGQAINDTSLTIQLPGGDPPTFSPMNYDLHYHGAMTLRCALQNSLNIPAVKTLQHVGIDTAMKTAYNMGVTTYEGTPGYSLVLGGLGVRLLDHTSAFGTFANGGVHVPYYAVQKVVFSSTGQTVEHTASAGTQVISPQLSYMMTNVLSDNTDRLPEFFDCNPLQLYSNSQTACYGGDRGTIRPAAAKTGTTNDFKDNWTMGYTTDYVMGVWAGNDNNTAMINVTGVQGAAPIWHDSMLLAEQGHPIQDFTDPGGLVKTTVTYPDGLRTTDLFLADHVPAITNNNGDNGNNNNGDNGTGNGNGNNNGGNGTGNGGNTQFGTGNGGNPMINMGSTLGSPLKKKPKNGNNGDKGNGNGTGGSPYCPNDFSYAGGGSSGSGLSVW